MKPIPTEQRKRILHNPIAMGLIVGICVSVLIASIILKSVMHIDITQIEDTVECGTEFDPLKCVDYDEEYDVIVVKNGYDPDKPGMFDVVYKVEKGRLSDEVSFTFESVDVTPPVIKCPKPIILYYGKGDKGLDKQIKIKDDIDGKITASARNVDGDIDFYTPGEYQVEVTATDSSGNEATKKATVRIELEDGSVLWDDAINHIGERVTVLGPLADYSCRPDVKGQPLFVNLGERYPSKRRTSLVLWNAREADYDDIYGREPYEDAYVKATGVINLYDGIAQMTLTDVDQVVFY